MKADKYHIDMEHSSRKITLPNRDLLSRRIARFYATQRKLPYAPVLGNDKLIKGLVHNVPTMEQVDFIHKAGLSVSRLQVATHATLRTVEEGTILFAQEPISDIAGYFAEVQEQEVVFEHAFDEAMTVAYRAMEMVRAANGFPVFDFSLRRDGNDLRSEEVARNAYIAGFKGTSSLSGAVSNKFSIEEWMGTAAHYWQLAFAGFPDWQKIAFEAQLDTHPEGTILLLDTVSVDKGMTDAFRALNTDARRKAFKGVRIDSGQLSYEAIKVLRFFEMNGVEPDFTVVLTGDLCSDTIKYHVNCITQTYPHVKLAFGLGTKLIAEIPHVAGIIFKMCMIDKQPVMKIAGEKSTLPGQLQIYRFEEDGFYVKDVIGLDGEDIGGKSLLHPTAMRAWSLQLPQTAQNLRQKVAKELAKFKDIDNYPVEKSDALKTLMEQTAKDLL